MENPIFKGGFYSKGERFCISQKRFCEMMKGETYFTWVCKGLGPSVDELLELSEADMVVFLGVVNFLLDDISYNEAQDLLSQISFDWLKEKNQLHLEMKAGSVFYVSAYLQV